MVEPLRNPLTGVYDHTRTVRAAAQRDSLTRPVITVFDPAGEVRGIVDGEDSASFELLLNDAGDGTVVLPVDHHLAAWSVFDVEVEEVFSVVVDYPDSTGLIPSGETRWSGIVDNVKVSVDEDGAVVVTWELVHDWIFIKSLVCWSNPVAPAALQWPKSMILAGPAAWVIKNYLIANFRRLFDGLWTLPDNLFDPDQWASRFLIKSNIDRWPVVVLPGADLLHDTTPWCCLSSRFASAADLIRDTLADGQLRLKVWRWVPGDPQPAPNHMHLFKPTVLVDVVEQSGAVNVTGTMADGLLKRAKEITNGGLDDVWSILDPGHPDDSLVDRVTEDIPIWHSPIPAVGQANAASRLELLDGSEINFTRPTAWAMAQGGKSPDWMNSAAKLAANAALGYLGTLIGNSGLGIGVFESQITDVALAFSSQQSSRRRQKMGRFGRPEHWVTSGSNGFSLSTLQALRTGMLETAASVSHSVPIVDGAPYRYGRDFVLGSRGAFQFGKQYWITRIHAVKHSWSRSSDVEIDISLGDDPARELPEARLLKSLESVGKILQALEVEA
ncbi:Gp37-like protein [Corynebacterium flavescens]|uniref:Gp37-like protein n=1 Tax=Corynebacterium flavescens TaxID=28028 RepID=UPI00289BB9DE|nr:hypothetical protein [Corynebacterium flavescens]